MLEREYLTLYLLEDTHWWYLGMHRIFLSMLRKYCKESRPQKHECKILDAGCGTGKMMVLLKQHGEVFGVDFEELALHYCHQRGLENITKASIEALPFANNTFDIITCFDVLYHLNVESDIKALVELKRVCKTGGLVLINVPAWSYLLSSHDEAIQTRHRYTKNEIKEKLLKTGFSIKRMTYLNFFLFPIIAPTRLLNRVLIKREDKQSDLVLPGKIINNLLKLILFLEADLLRLFNFPIGLSVFAVAQKR